MCAEVWLSHPHTSHSYRPHCLIILARHRSVMGAHFAHRPSHIIPVTVATKKNMRVRQEKEDREQKKEERGELWGELVGFRSLKVPCP